MKLEAALKEENPALNITINAEKPRKGCFEVRGVQPYSVPCVRVLFIGVYCHALLLTSCLLAVNDEAVLSLTDMPRPFKPLKALDMEQVAADVMAKC